MLTLILSARPLFILPKKVGHGMLVHILPKVFRVIRAVHRTLNGVVNVTADDEECSIDTRPNT